MVNTKTVRVAFPVEIHSKLVNEQIRQSLRGEPKKSLERMVIEIVEDKLKNTKPY